MEGKTRIKRQMLIHRLQHLGYDGVSTVYNSGSESIEKIFSSFNDNSHIILIGDLHKGAKNLFKKIAAKYKMDITFLTNVTTIEQIEESVTNHTVAIYKVEKNKGYGYLEMEPIRELANVYGLKLIIDNQSLSPYIYSPSKIGADIVLHSGMYYIPGYSNVIAGLVITNG